MTDDVFSAEVVMKRLRERVPIRRDMLEIECSEQPVFYEEASMLKAELRSNLVGLQLRRDQVRAQLAQTVRRSPADFGLKVPLVIARSFPMFVFPSQSTVETETIKRV